MGDRCQTAGTAHLDADVVEQGACLFGRELVGHGPAWRPTDKAQPRLPVEPVDLVNDTVDVERQSRAHAADLPVVLQNLLEAAAHPDMRRDGNTPAGEGLKHAAVGIARQRTGLTPGVEEDAKRPRSRDRDIELSERSCRRIAGIGETAFLFGIAGFVEEQKILAPQIDLTAQFDEVRERGSLETLRHLANRRHIGGDVLAGLPVAPGRGAHIPAILEAQRNRETVDLRFGHDRDFLVLPESEKAPDPGEEVRDVRIVEGIAQGEHRHRVGNRRESGRRPCADTTRGTVVADEFGEPDLEGFKTPPQVIVFGIIDLGRIVAMIEFVVPANLPDEVVDLPFGRGVRQTIRIPLPHRQSAPAFSRLAAAARASSVTSAPASMRASCSWRSSPASTPARVATE